MNLLNVTQKFKSEDDALDYLIRARWPEAAVHVLYSAGGTYAEEAVDLP